jgi:predicted RNase H-like HicB family nuclease
MTTLLAVYTSDGLVGRCDAKCYEAVQPDCDCICGGYNHGKGRETAIENTRQQVQTWIEHYTRSRNLIHFSVSVHAQCQQDTLWGEL